MAGNVLGMLVGAAIDRRDGDSGVKGAIEGYLVQRRCGSSLRSS